MTTLRPMLLWMVPAVFALGGCGPGVTPGPASATGPAADPDATLDRDDLRALQTEVSRIMDETSRRYHPVVYKYDEDLLDKVDAAEHRLSNHSVSPAARLMAEIDQPEEDDHFRETVRRWSAKTGRDFRKSLDELKADRAGLDPSKSFHPEFHAKFSKVFDEFIAIEIAEIRERRNLELHRQARPLLDARRAKNPRAVAKLEEVLNAPPFAPPSR